MRWLGISPFANFMSMPGIGSVTPFVRSVIGTFVVETSATAHATSIRTTLHSAG
jgi:hypothetical protein